MNMVISPQYVVPNISESAITGALLLEGRLALPDLVHQAVPFLLSYFNLPVIMS